MEEMKKNKVVVGRKKLSSKEVASHQDFNQVLQGHRAITKRPTFGKKRLFYLLILLVMLIVLIFVLDKKSTEDSNQEEDKVEQTTGVSEESDLLPEH